MLSEISQKTVLSIGFKVLTYLHLWYGKIFIHMNEKTGGCSRSSRLFTCLIYDWPRDCSGQGGDEIIRWLTTEVWQYVHDNMYISRAIFAKLANDFDSRCLSTTFVRFLQQNTWNLRGPPSRWYSWLDFFVFHIVFTFILKFLCLLFSVTEGT